MSRKEKHKGGGSEGNQVDLGDSPKCFRTWGDDLRMIIIGLGVGVGVGLGLGRPNIVWPH